MFLIKIKMSIEYLNLNMSSMGLLDMVSNQEANSQIQIDKPIVSDYYQQSRNDWSLPMISRKRNFEK